MSFIIDYNQVAEDHQHLLVLVNQTGTLISNKTFNRAWDRVHRCNCIGIPGQKRRAYVKYKRLYPIENNEWGDFQAHRKILGLVSIGECSNLEEFEELFDSYKKVKEEYSETLFNSRLIIFGMNRDGSPLSEQDKRKYLKSGKTSPVHSEDSGVTSDLSPTESSIDGEKTKELKPSTEPETRPHSNSLTKESTGAEVVFFPCIDDCPDLEEKLKEFISSIFFVLDGKRLDRSFERLDRMQLLCAPFERKDYVGLDTDTKSFRKKCQGRLRKHLADLCLQAGISGEAILHYETAIDILKSVNDWLWIGACYEGLCCASVILVTPRPKSPTLRRVESMTVKPGSSMNKDSKLRAGSLKHNLTAANGLQEVVDPVAKTALNPDDIIDKYRECILNYSKYKPASVIELEACLKACRFLIQQRNPLQAADFLQNVVYINILSTDEDKINRYCTLSELYTQLGFHRKAAFFRRIAAMQCVTPQNPRPNWHQCYYLMMQSLEGYKLCFNVNDIPKVSTYGWPILQYRVLNEIIYSAKRMGNLPLAVRHSTFLLQTLHKYLSPAEKAEIVTSLESLTSRCEGTTQALALENGLILPPLALTAIPYVRSFRLIPPAPHLEPVKIATKSSTDDNLFIYTPLSIGASSSPEKSSKTGFRWVAKDLCEVHLLVVNPMPEELKIAQIGLLVEGVELEIYPNNPVIPAESAPYLVKIMCRPKTSGELCIQGYNTLVYGVNSNCRLKDIPHLTDTQSIVDIIPSLPTVQVKSSFPQSAMFTSETDGANVVTTASASLYAGQSDECMISIHNTSIQSVDMVSVSLGCKYEENNYFSKIFNWCTENINSQLPIQPSKKMCFSMCVSGHSDFISSSSQLISSEEITSPVKQGSVQPKSLDTTLQIQYSGSEGLEAGYCRRCAIAFNVDILPSVMFVSWDVLPAESPDHCVLVFDIKNVCGHQLELQYTADQSIIIEPEEVRRVAVQVERCIFPSEPEPNYDLKNTVIKHLGLPDHYSQFLSSFVDIRWNIFSEKCQGKASIEYLKWTKEQLELISVSQVSWDIRINDELYTDTCNPEVLVGRLMSLDVGCSAKEDVGATGGQLDISCESAIPCCDSDSIYTLMGTDSLFVPKITDEIKFSTSFLFHVSGQYSLNIKFKLHRTNSEDLVFQCYKILLIVDEEDR